MTTLAVTPAFPVPSRELVATFTLTESGTNWVRVWCEVAPEGSDLSNKLKATGKVTTVVPPRVLVYEGQGGVEHPWRAILGTGGAYTLKAQEYTKGTGFSGGYEGDTRANQEETAVGSEATLSLYIGQRWTTLLGTGADHATLVFWVWNEKIQFTTVAVQGESSPNIINPTSDRAKTAAKSSAVALTAVALWNTTVSFTDVASFVSNFVTKFNAHIILTAGTVHNAADANNGIKTDLAQAPTAQNLSTFVTEALRRLRQHAQNDWNGSGPGSADGSTDPVTAIVAPNPYHRISSVNKADMLNTPVVQGVGETSDAYAACAELWRAYEAHRVSTAVHGAADSTNTLTALTGILAVHREFYAALAATAPSASPGDQTASALLRAWGFKEG